MKQTTLVTPSLYVKLSKNCKDYGDPNITYQLAGCAEHLLSQARACYIDLHRATARERYELLLQRCPGIVEHLALQDLASFLCITPQMLSKIRKNISFGAQK